MKTRSRQRVACTAGLALGLATTLAARAQPTDSVVAWGAGGCGQSDWPHYGQSCVPSSDTFFVALAAGFNHSLGVKADGSIVAWGDNFFGQCDVPSPNTGFVGVAAGWDHSLGLKADGSIVAWGNNQFGACNVPAPNTSFVAVAAGWLDSLGLKADGSIVAWGNKCCGQTHVPAPNTGFVEIASGYRHNLGLRADGSIAAWGSNVFGQCNVPGPNSDFAAVAAGGGNHSLGLKADGSIVAWGDNGSGQCNVPAPNAGFKSVAAGSNHSLGVKADGSIVAWGDNFFGQCDVPSPDTGFAVVRGGGFHSLGLTGGPDADSDGDGLPNAADNCPLVPNAEQADMDGDRVGDACDNCPDTPNSDRADADGDGIGDACDPCPLDAGNDADGDEICGDIDNCPTTPSSNQADTDGDGFGDPCDPCLERPVVSHYRFEEGSPDAPASGRIVDSVDGSRDGRPGGSPVYRGDVSASRVMACQCEDNTLSLELTPGKSVRFVSPFIFHDSYGDATLEFFVKPRQQGHESLFWTRPDNNDSNRYNIAINADGGFGFDYRAPSGVLHLTPADASIFQIPVDAWTHIAVVRDTRTSAPAHDYDFYVNGVYTTTQTDPNPALPDANQQWQISGRGGSLYIGSVDEIRFSSRKLAPSEFLINMSSCLPDFDLDGDVDGADVSWFEGCAAGPTIPLSTECEHADQDGDGDGDQSDFAVIQRCYSGAATAADPSCAR